jgi:hypothetical protein
MTPILLAANTVWIGLVIALWTKRLWETHYARFELQHRASEASDAPSSTPRCSWRRVHPRSSGTCAPLMTSKHYNKIF